MGWWRSIGKKPKQNLACRACDLYYNYLPKKKQIGLCSSSGSACGMAIHGYVLSLCYILPCPCFLLSCLSKEFVKMIVLVTQQRERFACWKHRRQVTWEPSSLVITASRPAAEPSLEHFLLRDIILVAIVCRRGYDPPVNPIRIVLEQNFGRVVVVNRWPFRLHWLRLLVRVKSAGNLNMIYEGFVGQ